LKRALFIALLISGGLVPVSSAEEFIDPDATATLVVFNKRDPVSADLANFYAGTRKIPKEQVVGLDCSGEEVISREEYDQKIAEPLREIFSERGWWEIKEISGRRLVVRNKIRFVALIRGIPLKIGPATTPYEGDEKHGPEPIGNPNEACVDSELAILGTFNRVISGTRANPYYRSFMKIREINLPMVMLVCRLDGPTAATVRKMIMDSIETEQRGLWGFAYIDGRNIGGGGLGEGDKWLRTIADDASRFGIPTIVDNGPATFPPNYPMRYAALYYGWYSGNADGPFLSDSFQFLPGAVAVHIHSFSAATLRNPSANWVAPLLFKGAAATLGNVYEPFLGLTPNLDIFHQRLQSGFTFAESGYAAQRALSWMNAYVGDPLYKPFRAMQDFLSEPPREVREWAAYRDGARTWFNSDREKGEQELRAYAARLQSGIVSEGLGLLQARAENLDTSFETFEQARGFYRHPDDAVRVSVHEASLLITAGRKRDALKFVRNQIRRFSKTAASDVLRLLENELAPPPPTPPPAKPPTAAAAR
jgi:uncharacterized protein (TIGR03790 family)